MCSGDRAGAPHTRPTADRRLRDGSTVHCSPAVDDETGRGAGKLVAPGRTEKLAALVLAGVLSGCGGGTGETSDISLAPTTQATVRPTDVPPAVAPTTDAALPPGEDATVSRVIDGDTVVIATGQTVRLIGIDTPETKDPRKPVQCLGVEAARRTAELLAVATPVRLVFDVERKDRFGRTLAYVYRRSDGLFVNAALVREGFAQVATFPPNVAHSEDFLALQREARNDSRGLWAVCGSSEQPARGGTTMRPATTLRVTTTRMTATTATAAGGARHPYYANCSDARQAGAAPMNRGEPGYGSHLDSDNDGVACET